MWPVHRHQWTRWKLIGYTFQRRQCRTCGKYQDRIIGKH
jgi:hypothetical protein